MKDLYKLNINAYMIYIIISQVTIFHVSVAAVAGGVQPAASFSSSDTPNANGPSSIIVDLRTSLADISSVYGFARCIDCLEST